ITANPPLLDVPTYSLATLTSDGQTGMNILTYATPVSVTPDRVWTIGLYKGTQSRDNFAARKEGVLQVLTEPHHSLVKLLGGSSGYDVNKQEECASLGFAWESLDKTEKYPMVLPKCAQYLHLTLLGDLVDAGSHDVAICKVESMFVSDDNSSNEKHLATSLLREMEIITVQGRVAT
ncbi:unnamed protein product, partial [Heterosigma akashiwo]